MHSLCSASVFKALTLDEKSKIIPFCSELIVTKGRPFETLGVAAFPNPKADDNTPRDVRDSFIELLLDFSTNKAK